jgi:hypothetical protein
VRHIILDNSKTKTHLDLMLNLKLNFDFVTPISHKDLGFII